ncbi:M12 family metallopeptidase [Hymenobacter caeli]|uniref:Peptidase metallopeptidase domain-containing protein n=1 Tax=Hymenobacter caeli TaxID=2735894 RepID=A0ABX2FXJ3_9BACT|nr:M12 family metallopeptidase [Hymenobacter caeli]NRT21171.1 hypothetical protein [Hymenobacter caeli]
MKYVVVGLIIMSGLIFLLLQKQEAAGTTRLPCGVPATQVNPLHRDTLHKMQVPTRHSTKTESVPLTIDALHRWPTGKVTVYFMDIYDYELITKALNTANEWSAYGNIKFILTTNKATSDIRVAFRAGNGYLSAVGTHATEAAYVNHTTMWLQNLDKQPKDEFKRVVLHEFGHSIGLLHEIQSPAAASIKWKVPEVNAHFKKLYGWEPDKVYTNVLQIVPTNAYTKFDPLSIMVYAIPKELTTNLTADIEWPTALSKIDKETIVTYYPF